MDFFNYCSNNEFELIKKLENSLSSKILEFELEKLEDDFLVFVSIRSGNNRLLIQKEGIIKKHIGNSVSPIKDVFESESKEYRDNNIIC